GGLVSEGYGGRGGDLGVVVRAGGSGVGQGYRLAVVDVDVHGADDVLDLAGEGRGGPAADPGLAESLARGIRARGQDPRRRQVDGRLPEQGVAADPRLGNRIPQRDGGTPRGPGPGAVGQVDSVIPCVKIVSDQHVAHAAVQNDLGRLEVGRGRVREGRFQLVDLEVEVDRAALGGPAPAEVQDDVVLAAHLDGFHVEQGLGQ